MTNEELREALRKAKQSNWRIKDNIVTVSLPDGRSQAVSVIVTEDDIQLESPVSTADHFDSPLEAATFLTEQHEGVIAICLLITDGWIVARKELPHTGLSDTELQNGIQDLAVDADRIEWLVTGKDVH